MSVEVLTVNGVDTLSHITSKVLETSGPAKLQSCVGHDTCKGLFLARDVISEDEERELLLDMEREPGHEMVRTPTANEFGWRYINTNVEKTLKVDGHRLGSLPQWMQRLWTICMSRLDGIPQEVVQVANTLPDHGIINHYAPGTGCAPHLDHTTFWGTWVLGVSLLSGCMLEMRRVDAQFGEVPVQVYLPPRSVYFFTQDARFKWTHAIAPVMSDNVDGVDVPRTARKSITLRRITPEFLTPALLAAC